MGIFSHILIFILEDLRKDLIEKIRKRVLIEKADYPWKDMDDFELLRSAGMYLKDYGCGQEGFTLAAALMFGKDHVIQSILPYHRVDAILRRVNIDRYDDWDDIRTNLIESYERLIAFIHKHMPDNFYLEGTQRISIRDIIFREIISNLLVHREYSNAYPSKLIIGIIEIVSENASKPHGYGPVDPNNFSPFPKNPVIAGIFKEVGLIDELGSGVRNMFKYSKIYFGNDPELIEGDVFKLKILLNENPATGQATGQADKRIERLIDYCKTPRTRNEMQEFLGINSRDHFRVNISNPLINKEILCLTIPDKPKSPNQKYFSRS